jgi:hypothetical protein
MDDAKRNTQRAPIDPALILAGILDLLGSQPSLAIQLRDFGRAMAAKLEGSLGSVVEGNRADSDKLVTIRAAIEAISSRVPRSAQPTDDSGGAAKPDRFQQVKGTGWIGGTDPI